MSETPRLKCARCELLLDRNQEHSGWKYHPYYQDCITAMRAESDACRDLLARIHRDGGHYTSEHGVAKSARDAEEVLMQLRVCVLAIPDGYVQISANELADMRAENEALRKAIQEISDAADENTSNGHALLRIMLIARAAIAAQKT